jgi:hypothetical protein
MQVITSEAQPHQHKQCKTVEGRKKTQRYEGKKQKFRQCKINKPTVLHLETNTQFPKSMSALK